MQAKIEIVWRKKNIYIIMLKIWGLIIYDYRLYLIISKNVKAGVEAQWGKEKEVEKEKDLEIEEFKEVELKNIIEVLVEIIRELEIIQKMKDYRKRKGHDWEKNME